MSTQDNNPQSPREEKAEVKTRRYSEGVLRVVSTAADGKPDNKSDWSSGFPYFGEAAETLEAIDVWNRTSLQDVLYKGSCHFLGDQIFCRLSKARWAAGRLLAATVEVVDPENNTLHRLRYRAGKPKNFA